MGFRVQRKASPRVTSHPPKVPHTLQIYTFFPSRGQPFSSSRGSLVPRRLSNWSFPVALVLPCCLRGCPNGSFLPYWCLAGCPMDPFLPPWCLASCPMNPFLPPWCLSGCPHGPFLPSWCSLSKAILCSERPFKGQSVLRAANRGVHPRICREPGRSPLKLY